MTAVLYLYLFSAVAGSLLVLVSLAGGGHDDDGGGGDGHELGEGDAHSLGDGHGGTHALAAAATHSLAATHAGSGTPATQQAGDGTASGLPTAVMWLLSVQLWTYFLAFGGLTGLLLRTLAHVAEPVAGLTALGVGLGTALGARSLLRRAAEPGDPGTTQLDRLTGSSARVLIPAGAGATGKIRLEVRGQTVDLLARATDGAPLLEGSEVIVLDVREGVAEVTTDSPSLLDTPGERARVRALPAAPSSTNKAP